MILNRNIDSKFTKNLIKKYEPTNIIKPKVIRKKNMLPSGGVVELDGYYKDKFENFFGVKLPKIKLHKTDNAKQKASEYHAHSYTQGNNIYLGKDVKPIDTVDGQTVIAHEITHVLQQKYLDMSSSKEMIDPSVELERKAQVVEDRVRTTKGIDRSSGDYFRKWDVLPQRSYQNRVASIGRFVDSKTVQRIKGEYNRAVGEYTAKFDNGKDLYKNPIQRKIDTRYPIQRLSLKGAWKSTKNIGISLAHSAGAVVDGVSSIAKLSASGYTRIVSVGADAFGYDKIANKYSKVTKKLQTNASDDLNDATKHFAKSGKYGNNAITQLVNDRDMFSQKNIDQTVGARDLHYGRNKYNQKLVDEDEAIALKWQKLSPKKSIYHRMGKGNENNRKYVSPDGKMEAVFYGKDGIGKEGTPINSAENEATYNYFSPNGISAIGHVATDVLPYYIWGNSKQDSTTFAERITASYDGENHPIQRKILNKYKNPIQRWSLSGAWDSVTNTASTIGNSVVNSASSFGKSVSNTVGTVVDGIGHRVKWVDNKYKDGISYIGSNIVKGVKNIGSGAKYIGNTIAKKWNNSSFGKNVNQSVKNIGSGAKYIGNTIAKKWNSSSFGKNVNQSVKKFSQYIGDKYQHLDIAGNKYIQAAKYGAFGVLDTATAIGKGALAVGTSATGIGAVTFGTAAALDANDAYKNFKNAFKLATIDTKGITDPKERVSLFKKTTDETDGIIGDLGDVANSVGINSVGGRLRSVDNFVSHSAMLRTLQVGTDLFVPSGITKQALKHGRVVSKFTKLSNKTVKQIDKFDALRPLSRNVPEDVIEFAKKQKKLYKRTKNVKLKGKKKKLYNERREISKLLKDPAKTNYKLLDKMMEKSKNSTLKQKSYLDKSIKDGLRKSRPTFTENLKGFGKSIVEHVTPFTFRETISAIKKPSLLGVTAAVKDYKAFTELDETDRRLGERFKTGSVIENPPQKETNNTIEKYAKTDRDLNTIDKTFPNSSSNLNQNISDSLDELSIKMFMRLKSEIRLEYARVGR